MINLVPAVGELNGDRSNYKFAVLEGEERVYGSCDFEVNHSAKHVEPARSIQGDIARIYFYMQKKYDLALTPEEITLFQSWAKNDPITEWEQQKHRQINNLLTALEKNELKNKQFAADE